MMLELAVGDAYGAGFEFVSESLIKEHNDLSRYHEHSKYCLGLGKYTDDTQMSLAIAELLLEDIEFTPENIANKFVEVFKRDPREGYAQKFYEFLVSVKDGNDFLARIHNDSDKSGGAMRATPLGFLPGIEKVEFYSRIQARLTHNTPVGLDSAVAASLFSHYFLYNLGKKEEVGLFLEDHLGGRWDENFSGRVRSYGEDVVRAAVSAVKSGNSLAEVLMKSVAYGGDTDTVATIALSAASCSSEIKKDLPLVLLEGLENEKFGKDYLTDLDIKLKRKFNLK